MNGCAFCCLPRGFTVLNCNRSECVLSSLFTYERSAVQLGNEKSQPSIVRNHTHFCCCLSERYRRKPCKIADKAQSTNRRKQICWLKSLKKMNTFVITAVSELVFSLDLACLWLDFLPSIKPSNCYQASSLELPLVRVEPEFWLTFHSDSNYNAIFQILWLWECRI